METQRECPLVSVVIPVGGTRAKDTSRLIDCVVAICRQTYRNIEVILVIDPNSAVRELVFPCPVVFVEYNRPENGVGRDEKERYMMGWDHAKGKVLALTGVSLVWKPDMVETALNLMSEKRVEAVDGITRRIQGDKRFLALFQDDALMTEFPPYKRDFILTRDSFARDLRLPCMTSFFMTRKFYGKVRPAIPQGLDDGWGDFRVVWSMIQSGQAIFCSNSLIAHRTHQLSLRLGKHFASGLSAANFYAEFPENSYAKKRLRLTVLVVDLLLIFLLVFSMLIAISPFIGISLAILAVFLVFALTGALNAFKSRHLIACFFPPLVALQIALCTCGFLYGGISRFEPDPEFLEHLHHTR